MRGVFGRVCCGIPVVTEMAWGRTRSRVVSVLVLSQLSFVTLFILFDYLGIYWIPSCRDATSSQPEAFSSPLFSNGEEDFLFASYLALNLLGVSLFQSNPWVIVAACSSLTYFVTETVLDSQYCWQLTGSVSGFGSVYDTGEGWSFLSVNSTTAAYGLLQWLATFIVTIIMTTQAFYLLWAAMFSEQNPLKCTLEMVGVTPFNGVATERTGDAKELELIIERNLEPGVAIDHETTSKIEATHDSSALEDAPQATAAPRSLAVFSSEALSLLSDIAADLFERLWDVPMRHCVASFLSSAALLIVSTAVVGWANFGAALIAEYRSDFIDSIRASVPLPSFAGTVDAILGVLKDVFQYLPIGIWAILCALLYTIWHSLYPVSNQVRWLKLRYSTALIPGSPPLDPLADRVSAPFLTSFGNFSASMFIFLHLVSSLLSFTLAVLLVSIVVALFIAIKAGSFGNAIDLVLLFVFRNLILTAVQHALPVLYRVLRPLFGLCGSAGSTALAPVRVLTGLWMFILNIGSDGPHIICPRAFFLLDGLLSFFVGPFIGGTDALSRLALGLVWGILSLVQFHAPLFPAPFHFLDRGYMAYGASLRLASADLMDLESGSTVPAQSKLK